MDTVKKSHRVFMFDIYKILFALLIFMRHSVTMGGCKYGPLYTLIYGLTEPIMVSFFMVSGFSLYYSNAGKNLFEGDNLFSFYKKRAISILPLYFLVHIVHVFVLERDWLLHLKLLPIQTLGIQTYYDGLFYVSHNGTTWFVSCLFFSYFLYPLVQEIIKRFSVKIRACILVFMVFLSTYSPWIGMWYPSATQYANPLFRGLQFFIGVVACSLLLDLRGETFEKKTLRNFVIIIAAVGVIVYSVQSGILELQLLRIALIVVALVFAVGIRSEKLENSKILHYASTLTYPFYILQDFIWSKSETLNGIIRSLDSNFLRITGFFMVLLLLSILSIELYQKPLTKFLNKKHNRK